MPSFAHRCGRAAISPCSPCPRPRRPSRSCPPALGAAAVVPAHHAVLGPAALERVAPLEHARAALAVGGAAPPAIAPILEAAERAHAKRQWEEALEGYKKALMVLGDADPTAKASLYANIAEVKLGQGKEREAETNFEKALAFDPKHRRSHEALVKLSSQAEDWRRVVAQRQRLALTLEGEARAAELVKIADVCASHLADPHGARLALEEAHAASPTDASVVERLCAQYEVSNRWFGAWPTCSVGSPKRPRRRGARADLRFRQADVILARLREEERGLAALEAALEDDPAHERALAALVAVRTRRQEWRDLERLYTFAPSIASPRTATSPRARGGRVQAARARRKDKLLGTGRGAIDAWQRALRCDPKDVETRAALAEALCRQGGHRRRHRGAHDRSALRADARGLASAPLRALQADRQHRSKRGLAATALAELGATNVDQDMLVEQFRPEGACGLPPLSTTRRGGLAGGGRAQT